MITFLLSELAKITHGVLIGENIEINSISIDTRQKVLNTLFIALKGNKFDAHEFIKQAIFKGALALMIDKNVNYCIPKIIVKDTTIAFGHLGLLIKKKSKVITLAITGSSGKTTVKEMTYNILKLKNYTLCNYKNLNNKIGVPLTLTNLNKYHKYLVIEIGASNLGEINYLTNLVKPNSALVNNIHAAHLSGFVSIKGIAKAKGEIFNGLLNSGTAIINYDNNYLFNWKHKLKNKNILFYSKKYTNKSNIWASNIIIGIKNTIFDINFLSSKKIKIKMSLLGLHNIYNALAATALALSVNIPLNIIQKGLCSIKPIPGRLFPIQLSKNKLILDDTYNANFGSVISAFHVLKNMPGYLIIVIGEISELGDKSNFYFKKISKLSNLIKINKLISFGCSNKIISDFSIVGEHLKKKQDLINRLIFFLYKHEKITILIKGSRISSMNEIVNILKDKFCVNFNK